MNTEITALPAFELRKAFAQRTLSPVEAVKSALARIDALNEQFGAYCFVDHEQAVAKARVSEARWMRNEAR